MENFRIKENGNGGFLVIADSNRYGINAIVFEGIAYKECIRYIAKNNKIEALRILKEELQIKLNDRKTSYLSRGIREDLISFILEIAKHDQYKTLKDILINKFSDVAVDLQISVTTKNDMYISINNSIYKMVVGISGNGEMIRKPKNLINIVNEMGVTLY